MQGSCLCRLPWQISAHQRVLCSYTAADFSWHLQGEKIWEFRKQLQYLPLQDTSVQVDNFAGGDRLDGGALSNPVEQIFKSVISPERRREKVKSAEKVKARTDDADSRSKLQLEKERNSATLNQFVRKIPSPKGLVGWQYTCLKCGKKFKKSIRAGAHATICGDKTKLTKKRKKSQRKLACNICGHIENTKKALTQHRLLHHKSQLKWHRCTRCPPSSRYFLSVASYRRHVARHVSPVVFTCTFDSCGKQFATKANVVRHRRNVHLKESSASVAPSSSPLPSLLDTSFLPSSSHLRDTLTSPSSLLVDTPALPPSHLVDETLTSPSSHLMATSPLLVSSTRESELAPIEQIRNENIRDNGTVYLQLCESFGDSSKSLLGTTRILEGRLVLPKSPSQVPSKTGLSASKATSSSAKATPSTCPGPSSQASTASPSSPGTQASTPALPDLTTTSETSYSERMDFEAPIMTSKSTQTEEKFKCLICDFKGRDGNGLNSHDKKVHRPRRQVKNISSHNFLVQT